MVGALSNASTSPAPRAMRGVKDRVNFVSGLIAGGFEQTVNTLANRLSVPVYYRGGVIWTQGDIFNPSDHDEQRGADFARQLLQVVGLEPMPQTDARLREQRPLIAGTRVTVPPAGGLVTATFNAHAPGNDWGAKGRESTIVSVFVNGHYHSDVTVLAERRGAYEVNLGDLPPGTHDIELRSAHEIAPRHANPAMVTTLGATVEQGERSVLNRYAPVFETRDLGPPSASSDAGHTDTPLLVVPYITQNPDQTRTIDYYVLFSSEDGGYNTAKLFRHFGRGADYEKAYSVTVDAAGRKVSERFQAPRHKVSHLRGTYEGQRPVLRIATSNNMFSQRLRGHGPRWSATTTAPADPGQSSFDTMVKFPWTFSVMAKELAREDRSLLSGPIGRNQVGDPRSYLYVAGKGDAVRDALEAGRGVQLRMRDGKLVAVKLQVRSMNPGEGAALALPKGAAIDAIEGVEGIVGKAYVLGSDYRPRRLATGMSGPTTPTATSTLVAAATGTTGSPAAVNTV